uniref:Uncharacterized protein n=1 Tax=Anguilla anguilla TaxID=7936 RepID=A0A0E9X245_ANGAN
MWRSSLQNMGSWLSFRHPSTHVSCLTCLHRPHVSGWCRAEPVLLHLLLSHIVC